MEMETGMMMNEICIFKAFILKLLYINYMHLRAMFNFILMLSIENIYHTKVLIYVI